MREDYEIDLELRYSNIQLRSFGSTSDGLKGTSSAHSASLWSRYRAPTGYLASMFTQNIPPGRWSVSQ